MGNARTALLSVSDGPAEIQTALAALGGTGSGFTVTNPSQYTANIEFTGTFGGVPQALLQVVVESAPPGDLTFTLDLGKGEMAAALRAQAVDHGAAANDAFRGRRSGRHERDHPLCAGGDDPAVADFSRAGRGAGDRLAGAAEPEGLRAVRSEPGADGAAVLHGGDRRWREHELRDGARAGDGDGVRVGAGEPGRGAAIGGGHGLHGGDQQRGPGDGGGGQRSAGGERVGWRRWSRRRRWGHLRAGCG